MKNPTMALFISLAIATSTNGAAMNQNGAMNDNVDTTKPQLQTDPIENVRKVVNDSDVHEVDPEAASFVESIATVKPKPMLSDAINSKIEHHITEFEDRRLNFRTKRVMTALMVARDEMIEKLDQQRSFIETELNLTSDVIEARTDDLELVADEINATFDSWISSTNQLQVMLERNYSTYDGVIEHLRLREVDKKKRIVHLQIEAIKEQRALNQMEDSAQRLEKLTIEQKRERENAVDKVLKSVDEKATKLKKDVEEQVFLNAQNDASANLLTVVKIDDLSDLDKAKEGKEEASSQDQYARPSSAGKMSYLFDSDNNKYALIRPKDVTIMPDDLLLMNDLIVVLVSCFGTGLLVSILGLPSLVGHMFAGMLLGPAGFNMITSLVQIGTVGELGVLFLLFTLGLEFSLSKLEEVWRVAVIFGSTMLFFTICAGVSVGLFLERDFGESLYVSVCIALSSTALVANSLNAKEAESSYGRSLMGILLLQDVYLGGVVGATSLIATQGDISFISMLILLGQLILSIVFVVVVAMLSTKMLKLLLLALPRFDSSVQLLALLSICFVFMALTHLLGVSNELGCFVAGVTISATLNGRENVGAVNHHHNNMALQQMIPLQDFFVSIFFMSVGTHLYPSFLMDNAWLLIVLTASTMLMKYSVSFAVWILFWRSKDIASGHSISAGLCQISEFSFVLASRGIRMGFIPQSVYFLLVSVGGASLLLSPGIMVLARKTAKYLPSVNN